MTNAYALRYIRILLCTTICLFLVFGSPICTDLSDLEYEAPVNCSADGSSLNPKCLTGNSSSVPLDGYNREFVQCSKISFRAFYNNLRNRVKTPTAMANFMYCILIAFNILQCSFLLLEVCVSNDNDTNTNWNASFVLLAFEFLIFVSEAFAIICYYHEYGAKPLGPGSRPFFFVGILALGSICQLVYFLDLLFLCFVNRKLKYGIMMSHKRKYNMQDHGNQLDMEDNARMRRHNEGAKKSPKKNKEGEPQLTKISVLDREMFSPAARSPMQVSSQTSC